MEAITSPWRSPLGSKRGRSVTWSSMRLTGGEGGAACVEIIIAAGWIPQLRAPRALRRGEMLE